MLSCLPIILSTYISWHNSDSSICVCYSFHSPKVEGKVLLHMHPGGFYRNKLEHHRKSHHNKLSCSVLCVPCSQGAAVLWLQHHPGPAVRGRGLLQPRGYHLHPLAQRLQTPFLHQDREQWVNLHEEHLMTEIIFTIASLLFPLSSNSVSQCVCVWYLFEEYLWWGRRLLNHDEFPLACHWTLA